MAIYYTVVLTGVALVVLVRAWYRHTKAARAARDVAALNRYAFGARFSSAALAEPHDEAQAKAARTRAHKTETRRRKVAAARVLSTPAEKVQKVTPIRKVGT